MYVIIDDRETVTQSYVAAFGREGIACINFCCGEFTDWLESSSDEDLSAVDAFLLSDCHCLGRAGLARAIHTRCHTPVIALNNHKSLQHTLELFEAGVDDVVQVPVHVREVLVRTAAICRRTMGQSGKVTGAAIQVFFDGKDPEIAGEPLPLPRRELRILEYMVSRQGKWVTKTQIFNAIYGVFDSGFDESVIESHISKLRKKVRDRLGYDPILSRRYLGYRFDGASSPAPGKTVRRVIDPAIFAAERRLPANLAAAIAG